MNISELNFEPNDLYFGSSIVNDEFNTDSSGLELINEFFETVEEPIPNGRIYKGAKYSNEFEFGLIREKSNEIVFEDENYLIGFEPDDRRYYKEAYE
tara:strand:- start:437 stop:727 length:291 start_codon:yes stop_codon:yes gene_type:complete